MLNNEHPKSLLIGGESGSGKSTSLIQLQNQEGILYLNCEGGKPLPFKNKFARFTVDNPYEVFDLFDKATQDPKKRFQIIVVDTVSFLMERFESVHVKTSANTMAAWGQYGDFFRVLMTEYVAKYPGHVIFLGHLDVQIDEDTGEKRITVPVKGSLKRNGLEAYFTTVINARKVKVTELEKYENKLLTISDRERLLGFKHVFQTLTTKHTVGDRIRSPIGLFSDQETYINNDAQLVLDRLKEFYTN
jgi:hypothetical protein